MSALYLTRALGLLIPAALGAWIIWWIGRDE